MEGRERSIDMSERKKLTAYEVKHGLVQISYCFTEERIEEGLNLLLGILEGISKEENQDLAENPEIKKIIRVKARDIYSFSTRKGNLKVAREVWEGVREAFEGTETWSPEELEVRQKVEDLQKEGDRLRNEKYEEARKNDPIDMIEKIIAKHDDPQKVLEIIVSFKHYISSRLTKEPDALNALWSAAYYLDQSGVDFEPILKIHGVPQAEMRSEIERDRAERMKRKKGILKSDLDIAFREMEERQGYKVSEIAIEIWELDKSHENREMLMPYAKKLFDRKEYSAAIKLWARLGSKNIAEHVNEALLKLENELATGESSVKSVASRKAAIVRARQEYESFSED